MRALNSPWFSNFLLRVGDGTKESIIGNFICIPDDMTILFATKENSIKELFNAIFPSIENNVYTSNYIASIEILSTRNESVDEINDQMLDNFQGEEHVYYSFDEVEDDKHHFYPTEFLNALNVNGLPPHKLRLKIGCPIILLRNIDPSRGLCNGTTLICKGIHRNAIDAEIATRPHSGERMTVALRRLIFAVTLFVGLLSFAHSIPDKCRACNAVAEELEHEMIKEKPKNHLDLRNRLDSKGQRQGKVIDYKVSELRVVDLLDGLCDKMQDYTLQKVDSNKRIWMKVDDWDNITSNKQELRAYSKEISSYCGRLLEETEDDLAELIMKGSVKVGDVSKVLCHDLSKHCNSSSSHKHESSHDEEDDEVHGEL
ncbi:uncharacterized protein LOC143543990 [Bidens hawaiensis]|uniref:uncharacterized protein LOC143543990 n=1 Tax=Bidens hawaiensis TaxID=980011 RepID=UPI00404B734E